MSEQKPWWAWTYQILGLAMLLAWLVTDRSWEPALGILTWIGGWIGVDAYRCRSTKARDSKPPALEASLPDQPAPPLVPATPAIAIGQRMRQFIELLNEAAPSPKRPPFTVASIAQRLGLARVGDLEAHLHGDVEPSFDFVNRFAAMFGGNPRWIYDQDHWPFLGTMRATTNPTDHLEEIAAYRRIWFIRSDDYRGCTIILAETAADCYRVCNSPWAISGDVGAGGASQIRDFHRLLGKLAADRQPLRYGGRVIDRKLFDRVVCGKTYPGAIFRLYRGENHWWDDFRDVWGRYPIAEKYGELYGKGFLDAQAIVRNG